MEAKSGGMVSRGFFAWFLISVFYALQYIFRVMPNTFSGIIMDKFDVGAFSLGQFSGFYYVGYTAAHIPIGILMDRYGPKRVVPICMALTVLGAVPMLFESWYMVQIGRIITGLGSAAAALATFKVSNMYFGKRFAVMTSIATIIGLLGAMYGGMPVLSLVDEYGWNAVILSMIGAGCALAVVASFVLFDAENVDKKSRGFFEQIKPVFCNKKIFIVSVLGGLMIGPLEGFADGWATTFLSEVCGISNQYASILPSAIFVGSCVGSFTLSYMVNRSVDALSIIIYCGAFTVLAFILMLMGRCGTGISAFTLLIVIGFCSSYQLVTIYKSIEYAGSSAVALATAVSNMIIMVFGYFFHTIIAAVVNASWDGTLYDGHATYGSELLVKSVLVVPLGTLIGTLGYWIFKAREETVKSIKLK